jgi:hypothetical protein
MDATVLYYIVTGVLAGLIGSMVGLGGGIIVVPALTLILGVDMKSAISASLISLIATSAMSVMVYAKQEMIHYRLGLILCLATVIGSFSGSYMAVLLKADILMIVFALIQIAAVGMLIKRNFYLKPVIDETILHAPIVKDGSFFSLSGTAYSEHHHTHVPYDVVRIKAGFVISIFAGVLSGMLGVGGGVLQVPTMNVICKVPVKVSAATSSFMIGFTGLAGALIFFLFGKTDLVLTGSLVIGILAGAYAGAHWAVSIRTRTLTGILIAVLLVSATRFLIKAIE